MRGRQVSDLLRWPSVFEALVTVVILAALILGAWLPADLLLWVGVCVGSVGAVVGVPAGLVYHARLWRALRAGGHTTEGMWLRPQALHGVLEGEEGERVRALFGLGVLGFSATMLGAVGVVVAFTRITL